MKELLEDIRLNKVAYLIEILEKKDYNSKIKAFKKLEKIVITKNIGLFLINNSYKDFGIDDDFGGIGSSLIELCFKNYYDEYTDAIKNVFPKLNKKTKERVVYLLTTLNNEFALRLYAELIIKYFKDGNIPIGNLYSRPETYTYLFPTLYKTLKFDDVQNNVLILISNYLNYGVVPKEDLKKYKKILTDAIIKVFDKALKLKIKYKNTFEALNNIEYKDIRFFLEICINIELYIPSKKTKEYLEKLYKKNDNQLKLFILDNYIRKNIDISKINLNSIAKDPASRYALYEFLVVTDKLDLFPKKYLTGELLAKSDFYTNFVISNSYRYEPTMITLYKREVINDFLYYIFKFNCTYKYNISSKDFLTNYICSVVGIEKYNGEDITDSFIGVSGGYDKNKELSMVIYNHKSILFKKIEDNLEIDDMIKELVPKKETIENNNVIEKPKKHIFDYILLFLLFVFEAMLIYCMLYVNDVANIGGGVAKNPRKVVSLDKNISFDEINGTDIFSMSENEYYVLFYKVPNNKKSAYYSYIKEYSIRNKKIYYVNLDDEKNKFLYENNNLNFILTKDRFLKVKNGEYDYYIDGKNNILNEMKDNVDYWKAEEQKQ